MLIKYTEQTPFTTVFSSGTYFTAESTDSMRIKCLVQGHDTMMQAGIEPLIAVS